MSFASTLSHSCVSAVRTNEQIQVLPCAQTVGTPEVHTYDPAGSLVSDWLEIGFFHDTCHIGLRPGLQRSRLCSVRDACPHTISIADPDRRDGRGYMSLGVFPSPQLPLSSSFTMDTLQSSYAIAANASLPTPPDSPQRSLHLPRRIDPTTSLLDSLVAFYHQERMWVYRTRASLELVLETVPSGSIDSAMSSAESDLPKQEEGGEEEREGLEERSFSHAVDIQELDTVKAEPTSPSGVRTTLWTRRKKGFKLKLEGISTRGRRRQANPGLEAPPTPGVQMLEQFSNMLQARMESCERGECLYSCDSSPLKLKGRRPS